MCFVLFTSVLAASQLPIMSGLAYIESAATPPTSWPGTSTAHALPYPPLCAVAITTSSCTVTLSITRFALTTVLMNFCS
eukprot:6213386-Pleurochrysis_carterae.AAC.3